MAGRIIVITGAGDGLGRALARRFAHDGEVVVLLGRTLAKLQAVAREINAGLAAPRHHAIACEVTDANSVRAAFAEVAKLHPKIDVLINNAGIFEPFTLAEVSDEQVSRLLMTNFAGPVYCAREALALFHGAGHIINVSSESSHLKMPMLWLYAGSKVGLEFVSDMWASELESAGVRVTVVRAGQMMDETKTGSSWPMDVAMRFATENARVGLNIRERAISHYNSVTDVFRSVLDTPADVHLGLVTISARKPANQESKP